MIQDLFGVAGLIPGDHKISINGGILDSTTPSPSLSPSLSASSTATDAITTATATTTISSNSEGQNLRCPRCDSSNTKFCYYNNYNLTQPRHFCKTCRRYWTKGGALRNVPIGGGCRKNKGAAVAAAVGKSTAGKMKTLSSAGFGGGQILWGSPQNSHLLAILRSTPQNPNPNLTQNSMNNAVKAELSTMAGTHLGNEPAAAAPAFYAPVNHLPSLGLCSSYWKNQVQQQNGYAGGDQIHGGGVQEFYQKLRSSSTNYCTNEPASVGPTSSILESAPVAGGETGYWNPGFSWSDIHMSTNGSYP